MANQFHLRIATPADVPVLRKLIGISVRGLQGHDYSPEQLEAALETVYGVDSRLIADKTYFVVEAPCVKPTTISANAVILVGCGGWSKRRTLFGGDVWRGREDTLLDSHTEPAKIRAFFVHPEWARRGIGGIILDACEAAAKLAGFTRLEMGATLTGVPFYRARGYKELESIQAPLKDGLSLPIIRMAKSI
jgi:GNAT superfamily N-acetyltransferase